MFKIYRHNRRNILHPSSGQEIEYSVAAISEC
jgi:hypothetical protein